MAHALLILLFPFIMIQTYSPRLERSSMTTWGTRGILRRRSPPLFDGYTSSHPQVTIYIILYYIGYYMHLIAPCYIIYNIAPCLYNICTSSHPQGGPPHGTATTSINGSLASRNQRITQVRCNRCLRSIRCTTHAFIQLCN